MLNICTLSLVVFGGNSMMGTNINVPDFAHRRILTKNRTISTPRGIMNPSKYKKEGITGLSVYDAIGVESTTVGNFSLANCYSQEI